MTLVATRANHTGEVDGIDIDHAEPGLLVVLTGRLDSSTAHLLRREIDSAIASGGGDLVLDVRLAEVFDSAGLGVLVGASRRAHLVGRRVVVQHPSPRLERLVRAGNLTRVLHLQR